METTERTFGACRYCGQLLNIKSYLVLHPNIDDPDEDALAACRALGEAFGTGMTCIPAQGGFSHEEMTIVYFVVNRFQISRMKDIVHDLDDRAYITISEVADVFKLNQDKLSQKVDNQPLLPRRK